MYELFLEEEIQDRITAWEEHNKPHRNCYYMTDWAGNASCPGEFNTLKDYLKYCFDDKFWDWVENYRIFGHNVNEPNFWSKNKSDEFPVWDGPVRILGQDTNTPEKHTEPVSAPGSNTVDKDTTSITQALREQNEVLGKIADAIETQNEIMTNLHDLLAKRLIRY